MLLSMEGYLANQLFTEVASLTGLPNELIETELAQLLEKRGISPDDLTMDTLREVLAAYLADISAGISDGSEDIELESQ